jgi:ATP synthase protein I
MGCLSRFIFSPVQAGISQHTGDNGQATHHGLCFLYNKLRIYFRGNEVASPVASPKAGLYNRRAPKMDWPAFLLIRQRRLALPALDIRLVSQPRPLVDRSQALRLLKWQSILMVVLTLLALLHGAGAAMAVALGAGVAVAGSLYFAVQAFRHAGAMQAAQIVQGFYKGEAGKFVITVLLFTAVFAWVRPLQTGWLLMGFILEQGVVVWGVMPARTTAPKQ